MMSILRSSGWFSVALFASWATLGVSLWLSYYYPQLLFQVNSFLTERAPVLATTTIIPYLS